MLISFWSKIWLEYFSIQFQFQFNSMEYFPIEVFSKSHCDENKAIILTNYDSDGPDHSTHLWKILCYMINAHVQYYIASQRKSLQKRNIHLYLFCLLLHFWVILWKTFIFSDVTKGTDSSLWLVTTFPARCVNSATLPCYNPPPSTLGVKNK